VGDNGHDKTKNRHTDDVRTDRMIQVLSLEYQTLRDDVLVRSSGRFQFLGLMTTAAALLASGILGHSVFGSQTWIAAVLALAVFGFGLVCFLILGRQMLVLSARLSELEKRINALVLPETGAPALLSWESDHQQRSSLQKLSLGLLMRRF
jgi:hypothetical protein